MKNASSKQYSARLPLKIAKEIDAFYSGVKIADMVRLAIIEKFERESGSHIEKSDFCMSQGSRNDLPNRVTEVEKRARKGLRPRGRPCKLRVELGGGGSSGLIPARIDADGELRPLVPASDPREGSRRKTA